MNLEQIVPAIALIAVLFLVLPGFISSNSNKKIKAFFIGLFIWAAISAGTFGWFLGIDLLFARFSMSLWIFKKIKTKFYYDEISFHPMILKLKLEGYQFGMP